MNIEHFFKVLTGTPSFEQRIYLQDAAGQLVSVFPQLDPRPQKNLIKHLNNIAKQSPEHSRVVIYSLLFHLTNSKAYLIKSINHLKNLKQPPCDAINDHQACGNLGFTTNDRNLEKIVTPKLRRELYKKAVSALREQFPLETDFQPNPSRIVIIVNQFLQSRHAPTYVALKYADILQEQFGKEVLIVNGCLSSPKSSGAFVRTFVPNVYEPYSDVQNIEIEGSTYQLFQPKPACMTEETLGSVIDKIYDFQPSGIIAVGNYCAVAEVFAEQCFTMVSPTTNDLPECIDVKFHLHKPIDDQQALLMKEDGLSDLCLFQLDGSYEVPEVLTPVTRQELGLPSDKCIFIIVGNRLSQEITNSFLEMLNHIVTQSDGHIFFLGKYENYNQLSEKWPTIAENSTHCTVHPDIMAVYDNCDVFLAPERIGGGSSSAYAMAAGLPVLTMCYGDAQFAAKQFPEMKKYSQMGDIAVQLATDPDKMTEYKKYAEQGSSKIGGKRALIAEFLKHQDLARTEEAKLAHA